MFFRNGIGKCSRKLSPFTNIKKAPCKRSLGLHQFAIPYKISSRPSFSVLFRRLCPEAVPLLRPVSLASSLLRSCATPFCDPVFPPCEESWRSGFMIANPRLDFSLVCCFSILLLVYKVIRITNCVLASQSCNCYTS